MEQTTKKMLKEIKKPNMNNSNVKNITVTALNTPQVLPLHPQSCIVDNPQTLNNIQMNIDDTRTSSTLHHRTNTIDDVLHSNTGHISQEIINEWQADDSYSENECDIAEVKQMIRKQKRKKKLRKCTEFYIHMKEFKSQLRRFDAEYNIRLPQKHYSFVSNVTQRQSDANENNNNTHEVASMVDENIIYAQDTNSSNMNVIKLEEISIPVEDHDNQISSSALSDVHPNELSMESDRIRNRYQVTNVAIKSEGESIDLLEDFHDLIAHNSNSNSNNSSDMEIIEIPIISQTFSNVSYQVTNDPIKNENNNIDTDRTLTHEGKQ